MVTDVGDEISWLQLFDVGDKSDQFADNSPKVGDKVRMLAILGKYW